MKIQHLLSMGTLILANSLYGASLKHHYVMDKELVGNGFKMCVIGDTGTGGEDQHRVAAALEKDNCDQIRIVGDLIYPKGLKDENDPQFEEKFSGPFRHIIQGVVEPKIFLMLGNHDYHGDIHAWQKLAQKHPYLFHPHPFYSESYPRSGICIMTLDTKPFDSLKHLIGSIGQATWAGKTKRNMQGCEFSIAFGHHPFINSGHHGGARAAVKYVLKRNVIGKFDLYLSGHEHFLSDEGVRKGTALYISGAGAQVHETMATINPEGGYGASRLGYLTIQFSRNSDQKIVATTEFKEIVNSEAVTVHKKSVVGQGIRK